IANSLPAQLCLPPGEITCQPSPGATVCCLLLHDLHSPEEAFLKTSPSTAGLMQITDTHTHTHTHTHTLYGIANRANRNLSCVCVHSWIWNRRKWVISLLSHIL